MTLGTYMFYGGLACFGLCLVGLVITKAVLAAKGKKLKARFDEEYGSPETPGNKGAEMAVFSFSPRKE